MHKENRTRACALVTAGLLVSLAACRSGGGSEPAPTASTTGAFAAARSFATGPAPSSLVARDLNGDGVPDLAAGSGQNVSVLLGSATARGSFAPHAEYAAGNAVTSVVADDFSGDGLPDLLTTNINDNTVALLYSDSGMRGTFGGTRAVYGTGSQPFAAVAGDFSGDGLPDLAVANQIASTVSVLVETRGRTLGAKADYATGRIPRAIASGDFNGDGIADLVTANASSDNVSILLGSASARGTFPTHVEYAVGDAPGSVAVGDVNGDGVPDLAVTNGGNTDNTVSILLGSVTSPGTFAPRVDYATGSLPEDVALGDVNGDSLPDIAVANRGGDSVSVLLGSAARRGAFAPRIDYPVGTGAQPSAVVIGDFNGDGRLDIATANAGTNSVALLLGR